MSKFLEIYWAKTHNLKNVNVKIPKNKMTVITGVSGSWKSSLAFNTIYNVWQQKYLESLSSYARMFIWWMKEEALVEEIKWLSPTISIDQKTTNKNPRSTVGTITEIYDYYKLLYLNIWKRKCIKCDNIIKKDSINSVIEYLENLEEGVKFMVKAPLSPPSIPPLSGEGSKKKEVEEIFSKIKKEVLEAWFIRFSIWEKIFTVNDEISEKELEKLNLENINIIVDRLVKKDYSDENSADMKRLKDSLSLAFKVGKGLVNIEVIPLSPALSPQGRKGEKQNIKQFSNIFICSKCNHIPANLSISSFSFNSHSGACKNCHGLWIKKVFLEEKIFNPNLTLLEWAVKAPWFWGNYFFALLEEIAKHRKIDLNSNWSLLSKKQKDIILHWTGERVYKVKFTNEYSEEKIYNSKFEWVINTLERRYFDNGAEKWHYDDFVVDLVCFDCNWHRLNQESLSVYLTSPQPSSLRGEGVATEKLLNIWEVSNLSVKKAIEFFKFFKLNKVEEKITKKVLKNIRERLEFLAWVGLDYISISRKSGTLSGWEAQRIRLATQIWTKLEWIIYVLDEPSIWLHPRDNDMLIENLKNLRDIWNTLIIVEHDEEIMKHSDHIIDIWPWAWIHGWEIVAEGNIEEIIKNPKSVTGPYLSHLRKVIVEKNFRPKYKDLEKNNKVIRIFWAKQNNLKSIDVVIPLSNLVVITGVSGSWKSSLVNDILANYLANHLNRAKREVGKVEKITGLENLDKTVIIDQSPIWKTPRSNPATYTQVFTPIREVFAMTEESQIRGYTPGNFSFNTKTGRCDVCDWDWVKKIEMHFLPPVYVECEGCNGTRYNKETMQIKYKWKTISDVLNMTVEEAFKFFENHPKINKVLNTLGQVWLWYIKLWQSSTTLSGWEAQRIKLSTELSKRSTGKTFYILDEPTTGLHFQDVDRLLKILHSLVDSWNTVLVIEHNLDVIKNADHIIDIWPEWWDAWGEVMVFWTVKDIEKCKESYTWEALRK